MPMIGDLRVWHVPQVPGDAFHVSVKDVEQAKLVLKLLANYDHFQWVNNIKPDYCNVNGLEVYSETGGTDGEGPGWEDWESSDGESIEDLMEGEDRAS